ATIVGGTGAGIPRPLMHRYEVDVGLMLDERLRPVSVVHIPIDDQHAFGAMPLPRVVRADGHVAEQTEAHRARAERVMSWRAHRTEAARRTAAERAVDAVQNGAGSRGRGVP